jgi:hypothetical protein
MPFKHLKLGSLLLCTASLAAAWPALRGQQPVSPPALKHDALIPAHGTYLGMWVFREPDEKTVIEALESKIGRKFAIGLHYYGWKMAWPNQEMEQDAAAGRIPLVSWNCGATDADVAAGLQDDILVARAHAARAYGRPIFLRWYWEFNLPENQHTGMCLGMESSLAKQQSDFIAAWRHMWNVFQREGATNVVFVWNPNSTVPKGALDPKGFYPGPEYVDWIAWDKYDQIGGTSFDDLFADFIQGYGGMGKPLMIGETGAHPAFQAKFLAEAAAAVKGPDAKIKAIVYFDAPGHRPLPWTLSAEGIEALKKIAATPQFAPMGPAGTQK